MFHYCTMSCLKAGNVCLPLDITRSHIKPALKKKFRGGGHAPAPTQSCDRFWHTFTGSRACVLTHNTRFGVRIFILPDANFFRSQKHCTAKSIFNRFYPSARWARRGIVFPFVRRRRLRIGYYTSMVQHIEFIIHTDIQHLPTIFFTRAQGRRLQNLLAIT